MRKFLLLFVLILPAGCAAQGGADSSGDAVAPAAPAAVETAPSPDQEPDSGGGMTLQDVADEVEWRKKAADDLEKLN